MIELHQIEAFVLSVQSIVMLVRIEEERCLRRFRIAEAGHNLVVPWREGLRFQAN